jgi:hypothetical protein
VAETELDVAQRAVALVRGLQPADDALVLAVEIVDYELDRGDVLSGALGGSAAAARKLGQLAAKVIVDGLVEAHVDHAALALGQSDAVVDEDRHMHASADQSAGTVRAPNAPAVRIDGALGVDG